MYVNGTKVVRKTGHYKKSFMTSLIPLFSHIHAALLVYAWSQSESVGLLMSNMNMKDRKFKHCIKKQVQIIKCNFKFRKS